MVTIIHCPLEACVFWDAGQCSTEAIWLDVEGNCTTFEELEDFDDEEDQEDYDEEWDEAESEDQGEDDWDDEEDLFHR
jgi:hypothetical protein